MTTTSAQIISVERTPGWWRCKTMTGEWVNVFAPSGMKPGTLRFFEAAGYGELLADMAVGATLRFARHPIGVEMCKPGQYWEIAAVRPGVAEADEPLAPDAALYRDATRAWATRLLSQNFVVLNTETTGVQAHDEPIQIGMIVSNVRPEKANWRHFVQPSDLRLLDQQNGAAAVHGLTRADLETAEVFEHVYHNTRLSYLGKEIVIGYNIGFDMDRLDYACHLYGLEPLRPLALVDVMPRVAEYIGQWDAVKERWRTWKLSEAAEILGIAERHDHDALGDCETTLALLRAMAAGVEPDGAVMGRIMLEKEVSA